MYLMLDATKRLVDYLKDQPMGAQVTFASVFELTGRDPLKEGRGLVQTARRYLKREMGQVWAWKRGMGLVRLNDHEIVEFGSGRVTKGLRSIKRGATDVQTADYKRLSDEGRKRYDFALAAEGITRLFNGGKVKPQVHRAPDVPPLPESLAAKIITE